MAKHIYLVAKAVTPVPYGEYKNSGKPLQASTNLLQFYGPVENQGQFGACTAFASLQWRGALRRQAGLSWPEPAYFANYYEERKMIGTINQDSGASMPIAVEVLEQYGAMPAGDDPYTPADFALNPLNAWDVGLKLSPSKVLAISDETKLTDTLDALSQGHPVLFGMVVFAELESEQVAQTGVLPMPANPNYSLGGHAVNAVDFDDVNKRILVRNQWGSGWGIKSPAQQQGCFWMPYEYFTQYAYDAFVGLPDDQPKLLLWHVQVGAFSIQANADKLAAELVAKGFAIYQVEIGGLYKVQVGAFSDKANADGELAKVKAAGFADAFIVQY